jgi:glycerate dehydrogenase
MKKIVVLEKTNFSTEQKARLAALGDVEYCDYGEDISTAVAIERTKDSNVVVVNWIDPSPFLLSMKPHSLVELLSTGYSWIQNISEAKVKGTLVANIPAYSTEAVAEHVFGLLLGVSKRIFAQLVNEKDDGIQGFELANKTVGIIGMGHIGTRFAEIVSFFGAKVLTYNRTAKNNSIAKDVSLNELLSLSDIICITPSVNDKSRALINDRNMHFVKDGVVLVGSTWDIITETALVNLIAEKRTVAAFDAALEARQSISESVKKTLDSYVADKKLFLTPHSAYNTTEAEERQLDICISNIENFLLGKPQNIVG